MFTPQRFLNKPVVGALAFAIALATPVRLRSGTNELQDAPEQKVITFLNANSELRKSFTCRFKGEFRQISRNLLGDLRQNFPMFKFYVAKMDVYLDPPVKEYDLIVLADAKTDEIAAYVWGSYWTLPPSASFERILQGRQAKSKEDALDQLKALAKLIVKINNDRVGRGISERGRVKVELLRGDGVFRILEVKIDKNLRLGRLSITGVNGKKQRYFV